ncbi:MAG: aminoacyl-tRNA hydrolase, partial [Candidatus Doudnabacteria bacterium]|nr:aminoacyl-tRNA hydrolase [Candidatus Doudnabacteria bacterium]
TWILAKPTTFMNLSGEAARALVDFYDVDVATEFLVMYDDIDIPLGEIRTTGTSSGGHNGMKSLFQHLGTQELKRVRIGIDSKTRPEQMDTADYVLQRFTEEELNTLHPALTAAHESAFKQLYTDRLSS